MVALFNQDRDHYFCQVSSTFARLLDGHQSANALLNLFGHYAQYEAGRIAKDVNERSQIINESEWLFCGQKTYKYLTQSLLGLCKCPKTLRKICKWLEYLGFLKIERPNQRTLRFYLNYKAVNRDIDSKVVHKFSDYEELGENSLNLEEEKVRGKFPQQLGENSLNLEENSLNSDDDTLYINRSIENHHRSENDDENKKTNFEVQSLETTPPLNITAEAIPNLPLAKKTEVETGDQGLIPQSDGGGVFAPPCSINEEKPRDKVDPLKQSHERRQAYRKKQQSGGFKDEHLADKFSPLFVEQGKVWGTHPQEVFEGFEAFILKWATQNNKPNPQGYVIGVISKTVKSFNQGKISEQFLWNEYLKANKPPATEPDPIPYLSAINLFKTFYNSNMDFAKLQIEDVCKKLDWTFERFIEYAHTKGDLLDFSCD